MRTEARTVSIDPVTPSTSSHQPTENSSSPQSTVNSSSSHSAAISSKDRTARFPVVRFLLFAVLAVSGVAWDLYSKWYVFDLLGVPGTMAIWKGSALGIPVQFDLATTFNHGALWGIGQNQTWVFASLSVIAVCAICYFVGNRQALSSWWLTVATGLLLAGTLGNLYDRLSLHGWKGIDGKVYAVRDFLDFIFFDGGFHWATFNFADVFLVTGAVMLVIQSFLLPNDSPEAKVQPSDK